MMIGKSSKYWDADYYEMKKLLKQLDAYIQCGDYLNAKHIGMVLSFKAKHCPQYEEERKERKLKL